MSSFLFIPGVTHKKEWDSFCRSKERFKVHEYYQSNKLECFNMWLNSGKSWDAVALQVERSHQQQHESTQGWISVQGKEIKKQFNEEKAASLIASRKQSGMYYESTDFPNDDDETFLVWIQMLKSLGPKAFG